MRKRATIHPPRGRGAGVHGRIDAHQKGAISPNRKASNHEEVPDHIPIRHHRHARTHMLIDLDDDTVALVTNGTRDGSETIQLLRGVHEAVARAREGWTVNVNNCGAGNFTITSNVRDDAELRPAAVCTCGDPDDRNRRHNFNGAPCLSFHRVDL